MQAIKFGGSGIEDEKGIYRAVEIVKAELERDRNRGDFRPPLVVISALKGVTNSLEEAAKQRRDGSQKRADQLLDSLGVRHADVCSALHLCRIRDGVREEFQKRKTFRLNGSLPAYVDDILAAGELASSKMLAEALTQDGVPAVCIDAREIVITDDNHTNANPDWAATAMKAKALILPIIEGGLVAVMGGFIGRTKTGATTTIGREGSDFTATLVGSRIGVNEVHKFTSEDGIYDKDPRVHKGARIISHMSFAEADRFAKEGGMLHWRTIEPLVERKIPLIVRNVDCPSNPGTRISG